VVLASFGATIGLIKQEVALEFARQGTPPASTPSAPAPGVFSQHADSEGNWWSQNSSGAFQGLPPAQWVQAAPDVGLDDWDGTGTFTNGIQTAGTAAVTTAYAFAPAMNVEDDTGDADVALIVVPAMESKYRPRCVIRFRTVNMDNGRVFIGLTLNPFGHADSTSPAYDHIGISFDKTTVGETTWQLDRWDSSGSQTNTEITYTEGSDWALVIDVNSSSSATVKLHKDIGTAGNLGPATEVWSSGVLTTQIPSDTPMNAGVSLFNDVDAAADNIAVYDVYYCSQPPGY